MTTTKKLYGWDVDRDGRFACAATSPYDDAGKDLILFNGMALDEGVMINLEKPKRGEIADFLYSPLLLMFVSARALEAIQRGHVPNVGVHRLILRDPEGRVVDEDNYFWINVKPLVMLLDTERSVFQSREDIGGVKRVDKLVVLAENVPEDDLFLMKELNLPVFSETIHREIEAKKLRGARFRELEALTWPVW